MKPGDLWAEIHAGKYGPSPYRNDRLWEDVLFARVSSPTLPSFPPADEAARLADQLAVPGRPAPAYLIAQWLGTSAVVVQAWLDGTSRPPGRGEASDLSNEYDGTTGVLRLFGALRALAEAGGPPPPAEPVPEPEPVEAKVLGGDGFPSPDFLRYFGLDESSAHAGVTVVGRWGVLKAIVAGEVPMLVPTLDRKPTPEQARRLRESVPGLRAADVAALLEYPPYPAFERGEAGLNAENVASVLRLFGCLAAYAENHSSRGH